MRNMCKLIHSPKILRPRKMKCGYPYLEQIYNIKGKKRTLRIVKAIPHDKLQISDSATENSVS